MGTNFYKIYFTCGYWVFKVKHKITLFSDRVKNVIGYNEYIQVFKYNPMSKVNNHKICKL